MDEFKNEMIEGRNAVLEALRAGRALDKVYIARGETDKALAHIAGLARERGVSVSDVYKRQWLSRRISWRYLNLRARPLLS